MPDTELTYESEKNFSREFFCPLRAFHRKTEPQPPGIKHNTKTMIPEATERLWMNI